MIEAAYKEIIENVAKLKATPFYALEPFPAIAYKITPFEGGPVYKNQLEVRIIGDDFDQLAEIRDRLIKILDMEDSVPSLSVDNYIIRSKLAGGGWLFNSDTQMWELYPIFTTMWRYKNE